MRNDISATAVEEQIKVVSYNIEHARKIDLAIKELTEVETIKRPDILMVQEMDTVGVKAIAAALDMNYVYYPGSYGEGKKYFGNGILTKWPMLESDKIVLPHQSKSGRKRIAISARVASPYGELIVTNVHLETLTMKRSKRSEQLAEVLSFLRTDDTLPSIIGGDFNSFFPKDRKSFAEITTIEGFQWDTPELTHTARGLKNLVKPYLDQFYSKNVSLVNSGVEHGTKASDHFPIWAFYKIE